MLTQYGKILQSVDLKGITCLQMRPNALPPASFDIQDLYHDSDSDGMVAINFEYSVESKAGRSKHPIDLL